MLQRPFNIFRFLRIRRKAQSAATLLTLSRLYIQRAHPYLLGGACIAGAIGRN